MTNRQHAKLSTVAREPDAADVWEDATALKAALLMGAWLKGSVHLSRPVSSLTKAEMKTLAMIAFHSWVVEMSHRVTSDIDPAERKKLNQLLMG
jgi:ornithine cyclodeaminase/alanine dehydrogenase-like protein (mu-crystallin family)